MAVGPLINYPGFSVLQFAIIAFYSIGRILVFFGSSGHHRFLQHRQDTGFFLVLRAIIAFYGIGRILVFLVFAIIAFNSIGRILVFFWFLPPAF